MQAGLIISVILILFTTNVLADLSIRYEAIHKNDKRPFSEVLIKQDLVRINPRTEAQTSVMIDVNTGDIVQVDAKSKRYFKINAHTLGQYASFYQQNKSMLQGLIDHGLQRLNPQKRGQVEQLLQQYEQGSKSLEQVSIKPSRRTHTVLGVECRVIAIYIRNQLQREVCISSYHKLGLNPSDINSVEQLKKLVQLFKQSAPGEQQQMLELLSSTLVEIQGLPMQLVNYNSDGKVKNIIRAGAISFRSIPTQAYLIPQDYEQQNLPVM